MLTKVERLGASWHALGVSSGGGDTKVFSKSVQRRFGSEVEVVNAQGKLEDIIYTGEETSITEVKLGTEAEAVSVNPGDNSIISRSVVRFSNEDVAKVETETLKFKL
jgi:hypothetical protein